MQQLDTYLCFSQGIHTYAIENHKVVRIVAKVPLSKLPTQRKGFRGLLLSDEKLIAVIDVEEFQFHKGCNTEKYYIIINFHGEYIGICASDIKETRQIKEQDWQPCEVDKPAFSYKVDDTEIFHLQLDLLQRR